MTWKEFKETIEQEIELMRPELDVDKIEINRIDITGCNDVTIGFDLKSRLVIDDITRIC